MCDENGIKTHLELDFICWKNQLGEKYSQVWELIWSATSQHIDSMAGKLEDETKESIFISNKTCGF